MANKAMILRAMLREAVALLPDPELSTGVRFETKVDARGGDSATVAVVFTRTPTSGVSGDRAVWVFSGWLNVEAFEHEKYSTIDKRYQRPKAEKHSLGGWIRSELGPRCELVELGKYDGAKRGQEVRAHFR
jgi:hypothetical protein